MVNKSMPKKQKDVNFLKNYLEDFSNIIKPNKDIIQKLIEVRDIFLRTSKKKGKILIFGNGGSAAISSHVSVDLTKNAKIRTVNFNESDLITCFANDYGYENWIKKVIEFYLDKGDVLILVSSSGTSKNIINAAKFAKKKGIYLITFSGFKKNNPLSKCGKINIWVNSKVYNHIENIHQIQLLSITDLIAKSKL